jgi:hypothetical protein
MTLLLQGGHALAGPEPGDIFREYVWRPGSADNSWQRVTGPDAEAEGARQFLPNRVNHIEIGDLGGAVRAEACVEQWGGHAGTGHKRMRVNGHAWIEVPEPPHIPGERGQGGPSINYQYFAYPCVPLPLEQIVEGLNTFEFLCRSGEDSGGAWLGRWWPQWGVYGVTFRVYYAADKPHPEGAIEYPAPGGQLAGEQVVSVAAHGPTPVESVDVVADYAGFDQDGNGDFSGWQYRYRYGRMVGHLGTAEGPQWRLTWVTDEVPSQAEPVRLCAWIRDATGLCFVTPAVEGLVLRRPWGLKMYAARHVPPQWQTRAGNTHSCSMTIGDDLSGAVAAYVVLATWNGDHCEELGVNGVRIAGRVGRNHNYSLDRFAVPLKALRQGENVVSTFSSTEHHGIEVMWPGPVLFVQFDTSETEGGG